MRLSLPQKIVLSLGVVAGIGVLVGAGTFATFTAQTTNPTNTFKNGTLVLSNKVDSGSTCLSTGVGTNTDTNDYGSCDTAFAVTLAVPGDTDSADITLMNEGSVAASDLGVFTAACDNADVSTETYHGSGNPCSKIQITVQQYSDAFTTESGCLYGGATGNVCDFSDATKTLAAFVADYPSSGDSLSLGALAAKNGGTTDTAWVRVNLQLPSNSDNTYQGRQATFALNWFITQVP
jgi:predicted ribosomally synthesized peptide with SipW-like signal peptide